jgi:hypothetical protein
MIRRLLATRRWCRGDLGPRAWTKDEVVGGVTPAASRVGNASLQRGDLTSACRRVDP